MAVLAVASGCTNTAYLGQNDKLYTGATVHIDKKGEIPAPGDLEAQLNTLIVPEPNSAFLGLFRVKLWLYNVGLFKESMGEPPVLLRSVMPDRVAAKMRTLLENKGYFQADVNYAVRDEEKTGNVQYNVAVYSPYTIGSVSVTGADSPLIDSLRATMDGTVLAVGEPYDLTKLQQERVRIDAALKDKGFFFFAPDLILFRADSSVGEHKVDLRQGHACDFKTGNPDETRLAFDLLALARHFIEGHAVDFNGRKHRWGLVLITDKTLRCRAHFGLG